MKYITTSIVYPNADPHIGYALELVQADFLARYYRLAGEEVYFLTGMDVHGLKIFRTAEKVGQTPAAFVNEKGEVYKKLAAELQLTHDRFITTEDADHIAMAQAFWQRCMARGDIYKKNYQAWYNVKEEEFLGLVEEHPDPAVFGVDPAFIEKIDEENYFFALSRYTDAVVEALTSERYKIVPANRRQELLNFVSDKGLQDVSISREKNKLPWGVPVPGDETQVMYVWFDALTNYLTASAEVRGEEIISKFWPASIHCVGKDIQRFHALLWTGMLLSAGLELPKELLVHGFLTSGGQKMSKSIGNVINPLSTIEEFGSDPVRWYLLKEVPTTGDADFTAARLSEVYVADLANDYGNLISRVWTMCQKYVEGHVPIGTSTEGEVLVKAAWRQYHQYVGERQIHEAVRQAHSLLVFCNKRIDEVKPWVLAKDPEKRADLNCLLYELLEIIRHVTLMVAPVMPKTSDKVAKQVFPEMAWDFTAAEWGLLKAGSVLGADPLILFPKKEV